MAPHPEHPEWLEVRFQREALADWGIAFPDLPAADELVLWIEPESCSRCGKEPSDGEFGAIDPEYITDEGLLIGPQLCGACLETV